MGAPLANDMGLSFKEKLQLAITETDGNEGLQLPSCSHTGFRRALKRTSSTPISTETADALMTSLRLNSICLLEKVAELLLLEREKAEISSEDSENLRLSLEAREKEIADLRTRLEVKEQAERKLVEENINLRKQCETLILRCSVQRPPPPQQNHQQVQVPSPILNLRPPESHPNPPVLQRKVVRPGGSHSPLFIPKPTVVPSGSCGASSAAIRGHHNQSQHHLRSDTPPQLSPAITPRPSPRSHLAVSVSDEEVDTNLEVPTAASILPQKISMSPFNQSHSHLKIQNPQIHDRRFGSPDRIVEIPRTRVYPAASSKHLLQQLRNSGDHKSYSGRERERLPSGGSDFFFNGIGNTRRTSSPKEVFDLVPVSKDFLMSTSSEDSDRMNQRISSSNPPPVDSYKRLSSGKESSQRRHFSKHNFLNVQPNRRVPSPLLTSNASNNTIKPPDSPKPTPQILPEETKTKTKREPQQVPKSSLVVNERLNCMTTRFPYYINETEDQMSEMLKQQQEDEESIGNNVEVPGWRIKIYEPLSDPEDYSDIEELTEAVFLKRHQRFEIDEKRRKRWDSQRVREETYLERLKRRMQERERQKIKRRKAAGRRPGGGAGESDDEMEFVHPSPEDILYIRVSDDIPISVFGHPMPITEKSTFELPWTPTDKTPPNSPLPDNNDVSSSAHDASSSSSVSSLPSLPSPTLIPHLRKPNLNPSPSPGGCGGILMTKTSVDGINQQSELVPPVISMLSVLPTLECNNSNNRPPSPVPANSLGNSLQMLQAVGDASANVSSELKTLLKR